MSSRCGRTSGSSSTDAPPRHRPLANSDLLKDIDVSRHRRTALVLALPTLTLAAALTGCSGSAESNRAAKSTDALPVTVTDVRAVEMPREVEAVGTLNAKDETIVSAEV